MRPAVEGGEELTLYELHIIIILGVILTVKQPIAYVGRLQHELSHQNDFWKGGTHSTDLS